MTSIPRRVIALSACVFAFIITLPAQTAQQDGFAFDVSRLTKAIGLAAGQTIADIGAGNGELTFELSPVVGPSGRVIATELNTDRAAGIRKAAAEKNLKNVTVVEGHATQTNLPDRCCDALVIRFVYHHFGDPKAMNASLFRSVKSGGHVAVIDFAPPGKEGATPANRGDKDTHGVLPATVISELREAGFELVSQEQEAAKEGKGFLVVMRKSK